MLRCCCATRDVVLFRALLATPVTIGLATTEAKRYNVVHATALVSADRGAGWDASRRNDCLTHSAPQSASYRSAGNHGCDGKDLSAGQSATREYRSGLGRRRGRRSGRRLGRTRTRSTSCQFGGRAGFGNHQRAGAAGDDDIVIHAGDFIGRGLVLGSDRDLGSAVPPCRRWC